MATVRTCRSLPTLLIIAWLFAALVLVKEFSLDASQRVFQPEPVDLQVYRLAGQHLAEGGQLYAGDFIPGLPFTYPPFAGAFFELFASVPSPAATWLWQVLNFLALVWVIAATMHTTLRASMGTWALAVGLAVASFGLDSIHGSFYFGQINVVLMALVALDFLPRRTFGGVGVGLAAGMKLTPAFFIVVFLAQGRYLAAAVAVVTFLITVGIGFATIPDAGQFWTQAISDSSRVGTHDNPGAQSLLSVLTRVFEQPSELVWLLAVAVTVALVWSAARAARRNHSPGWALGLGGIGACLVSPFTWFHHWVWLVPVLVSLLLSLDGLGNAVLGRAGTGVVSGTALSPLARGLSQLVGLLALGVCAVVALPQVTAALSPDWNFFAHAQTPTDPRNALFVGVGVVLLVGYVLADVARAALRRGTQAAAASAVAGAV